MQQALGSEHFAWGLMLHAKMVGQLTRCRVADSREFSFGSILVAWFLERVPMLCLRVLLYKPGARELRLRWWLTILVHHGGGEGGHYFTAEAAQVWYQMPQIIFQFPYSGIDFCDDTEMILPPREVFDRRGMMCWLLVLLICLLDSIECG
jgi:hypothetical protein